MNATARLSNALVRAQQEVLTITEHRLLLCALRCLHTTDVELPAFKFRMKDVLDRINGNGRALIHQAVGKLRHDRTFLDKPLFETLAADNATDTVSGTFNPDMASHLLYQHLKNSGFAQVNLAATTFTSTHAYRVFWLLSSFQGTTWKSYSLAEFRAVVLGDTRKYPTWNDLKRNVLEVVREQFEGQGYRFDYKEDKHKNKVSGITIQVPRLSKEQRGATVTSMPTPTAEEAAFEQALHANPFPDFLHLYNRLVEKHRLARPVAEYALRWVNETSDYRQRVYVINAALRRVAHQCIARKVTDVPQYTLKVLKEAKAAYLAQLAEQQEQRENQRSTSASDNTQVNSVLANLAANFKA